MLNEHNERLLAAEKRAEMAFRLPAGTLEAIRQNPSPMRTAEVIAAVRDTATGARPLLRHEGYHEGAEYPEPQEVHA